MSECILFFDDAIYDSSDDVRWFCFLDSYFTDRNIDRLRYCLTWEVYDQHLMGTPTLFPERSVG